jgi:cytochrome c biogenesis protein CcdA
MIDAPFALAFTAGMVATVNPCGFAMLPAYLGYFLGVEGRQEAATTTATAASPAARPDDSMLAPERAGPSAGLVRALVVGAVVSGGFLALFAVAGAVVTWTSFSVGEWSPWLTVVIGAVLVVLGLGFVAGWQPRVNLPRLDRGGRDRGLWSMFLFGLSYAVASLSCTIGPFTSVVASTFSRESPAAGLATFVAYGAGMGLLLMVLTATLALARQGLVTGLRRALPYVQRVSGTIMVLMGGYLTWFGVYELRLVRQGRAGGQGPVDVVTGWSTALSERLVSLDPVQVALGLALVVMVVVLVALLSAHRTATSDAGATRHDGDGDGHSDGDGQVSSTARDEVSADASSSPPVRR